MDQQRLQEAYDALQKKQKKEKKRERKDERIVIRAQLTRQQEREMNGRLLAEKREERSRVLREQYQASAVGIMEAFAREIAPAFQRMMDEHGDKLDGGRLLLYCSKSDYSGGHAIVCMTSPKAKQVLHRCELQRLSDEAKQAQNTTAAAKPPQHTYNPLLDPAVVADLVADSSSSNDDC